MVINGWKQILEYLGGIEIPLNDAKATEKTLILEYLGGIEIRF